MCVLSMHEVINVGARLASANGDSSTYANTLTLADLCGSFTALI